MHTIDKKIMEYINDQIARADSRARAYVFDGRGKRLPHRNIFVRIRSYMSKFIEGNSAYRWVTLSGLRGAGKTTLMHQLYMESKKCDGYYLSLAVDEVVEVFQSNISSALQAFEEIIGRPLSDLDKPLFLFLDEVQYDSRWGVTLKTLYDKAPKVFIFATGSAAVLLNSNADIARRTIAERIYPLSFTEFIKIKLGKYEVKGLSARVRSAIFESVNAKDLYDKLSLEEKNISTYYHGVDHLLLSNYMFYGSLPFMIALDNESLVYDKINRSLERVIYKDIQQLGRLSSDSIATVYPLLYATADMDVANFSKLANKFDLSRPKITEIFSLLEQTELLHRVYARGSHLSQATNLSSKFLFSSPAFRAMFFKVIGNSISEEYARGKILEDLVGMYIYRMFDKKPGYSFTYDGEAGGADFVVDVAGRRVVIEVGVNKKEYRQVMQTAEKVDATYSIIVSEKASELQYNEEANAVMVPLRYFLLA